MDWYWSFLSCINYTACNTASAGGNKCVATDYSEYNQPVSKYSRSTTNNWISDMNCDSTGLGYKTQSGHYHYPVITYMGSINYKACNLGSVYTNVTNDETSVKMTGQNRFKYYSTPSYTAIPCYSNTDGSALSPSLNSSGMATSIINNYKYYPA